jgi:hypothetical protein
MDSLNISHIYIYIYIYTNTDTTSSYRNVRVAADLCDIAKHLDLLGRLEDAQVGNDGVQSSSVCGERLDAIKLNLVAKVATI